jgi:type III restriction enzyme
MNLRSYYPDFVGVDESGTRWLLETKGQETAEVERKDEAAQRWCEDASELSSTQWRYLKVPQKQFEELRPATMADLCILGGR